MTALRALALGAVLLLTACLPVSTKAPVGATAGFKPDDALDGTWKARQPDGKGTMFFHFLKNGDGTMTAIMVGPATKKDDGGWMVFEVQTATLGERRFMNARETFDAGAPATGDMAVVPFPVLYSFDDKGVLTLYLIDEDAAKAAIAAGKIAGKIESGSYGDVVLTAPSADLDRFMQSPDGLALFPKPFAVLHRVR
jgi:hypothetical protein